MANAEMTLRIQELLLVDRDLWPPIGDGRCRSATWFRCETSAPYSRTFTSTSSILSNSPFGVGRSEDAAGSPAGQVEHQLALPVERSRPGGRPLGGAGRWWERG